MKDVELLSPLPLKKNFRWLLWIAIGILAWYQVKTGIIPGWQMQSDFPNYYTASRLLIEGKDVSKIYDNNWFQQQINSHGINVAGKFTPFIPPTALLLVPFTPFDPLTAKRVWLIINVLMLIPIVRLMKNTAGMDQTLSVLLVLVTGLGFANNFYLGQMYLLVLITIFGGYALIQQQQNFTGGFIWGIAAAIKIVPTIFLLPFLIRKEMKTILGFATGFLLLHLLALVIMGIEVYRSYALIFLNHLNGSIEGQSPFAYQFQSWDAFLRTMFVYDPKLNPNPIVNSNLLFEISRIGIYAVIILVSTKLIYSFRKSNQFIEWTFIIAGISLFEILPASASYHFILLLFPFVFLLKNLWDNKAKQDLLLLIISFASIGLLPIIFQKIIPVTSPLIFYRLWLMTIFYVITIWVIVKRSQLNLSAAHDT